MDPRLPDHTPNQYDPIRNDNRAHQHESQGKIIGSNKLTRMIGRVLKSLGLAIEIRLEQHKPRYLIKASLSKLAGQKRTHNIFHRQIRPQSLSWEESSWEESSIFEPEPKGTASGQKIVVDGQELEYIGEDGTEDSAYTAGSTSESIGTDEDIEIIDADITDEHTDNPSPRPSRDLVSELNAAFSARPPANSLAVDAFDLQAVMAARPPDGPPQALVESFIEFYTDGASQAEIEVLNDVCEILASATSLEEAVELLQDSRLDHNTISRATLAADAALESTQPADLELSFEFVAPDVPPLTYTPLGREGIGGVSPGINILSREQIQRIHRSSKPRSQLMIELGLDYLAEQPGGVGRFVDACEIMGAMGPGGRPTSPSSLWLSTAQIERVFAVRLPNSVKVTNNRVRLADGRSTWFDAGNWKSREETANCLIMDNILIPLAGSLSAMRGAKGVMERMVERGHFPGKPIIMPISTNNSHWTSAVVQQDSQGRIKVRYMDSFGGCQQGVRRELDEMVAYLERQFPSQVDLEISTPHVQVGSSACGSYTSLTASIAVANPDWSANEVMEAARAEVLALGDGDIQKGQDVMRKQEVDAMIPREVREAPGNERLNQLYQRFIGGS